MDTITLQQIDNERGVLLVKLNQIENRIAYLNLRRQNVVMAD